MAAGLAGTAVQQGTNTVTIAIPGIIAAVFRLKFCQGRVGKAVAAHERQRLLAHQAFSAVQAAARPHLQEFCKITNISHDGGLAVLVFLAGTLRAVECIRKSDKPLVRRAVSAHKTGLQILSLIHISKLLKRDILFYGVRDGELTEPRVYPIYGEQSAAAYTTENERAVAAWVFHNNKHAGATTSTLGNAMCLYLSVCVGQDVYGVVGIAANSQPLDAFENSIMLSILGECALAMKNDQVSKEREEAALLAKNEQLRANLLRSISHDLRTPLTSISGNAGILLSSEDNICQEKRKQLYADIYDDSLWLINLVENLLSVTRIEDGTMKLRLTTELLDEVIAEAMQHTDRDVYKRQGLVMLFARFIPIIGTLAIAGSLAGKKKIATTAGTLSTTNAVFVFLLIFIVLLVGALSFFPALALGPLAEFFSCIW